MQLHGTGQTDNGYIFCLLITHQHLSLNTIIVKGIHQAIGSYSRTARLLACIYYKYSHLLNIAFIYSFQLQR